MKTVVPGIAFNRVERLLHASCETARRRSLKIITNLLVFEISRRAGTKRSIVSSVLIEKKVR